MSLFFPSQRHFQRRMPTSTDKFMAKIARPKCEAKTQVWGKATRQPARSGDGTIVHSFMLEKVRERKREGEREEEGRGVFLVLYGVLNLIVLFIIIFKIVCYKLLQNNYLVLSLHNRGEKIHLHFGYGFHSPSV